MLELGRCCAAVRVMLEDETGRASLTEALIEHDAYLPVLPWISPDLLRCLVIDLYESSWVHLLSLVVDGPQSCLLESCANLEKLALHFECLVCWNSGYCIARANTAQVAFHLHRHSQLCRLSWCTSSCGGDTIHFGVACFRFRKHLRAG